MVLTIVISDNSLFWDYNIALNGFSTIENVVLNYCKGNTSRNFLLHMSEKGNVLNILKPRDVIVQPATLSMYSSTSMFGSPYRRYFSPITKASPGYSLFLRPEE